MAGEFAILPDLTFPGRSPRGMAKAFQAAKREALSAVGRTWHDEFLPIHFTDAAQRRYHYADRSWRYVKRKRRIKGHATPLVWSGTLRDAVQRAYQITSTQHSVKVRMTGPQWLAGYTAFRGRYGTGPDKAKEIKTVLKYELATMGKAAKSVYLDAMNRAREARRQGQIGEI